jgi:hypothetical protein
VRELQPDTGIEAVAMLVAPTYFVAPIYMMGLLFISSSE